ncbi:MAG: TRAP transporter substrate-binding protein [Rhodomicrobium sp.]
MHKRRFIFWCCLQLLALAGTAHADPLVLKFSHIGGPGSLYWLSAEEFARRVSKETNGEVRIELYPNSGLGSDTAVLKKLLTGEVDLTVVATPMSSVADEFGVFEMPFLVRNREHVKKFRDRIVFGYLSPAAKTKGYLLLGMWELGFRQITNNQRPVTGPESLKGLKLRVPKGNWRVKMFKAYGVDPVPMEFKDVYAGIEAGKIQGLETPLDLIYGAHIEKVQKYLSMSYHLYSPAFFVAGRAKFAQLPPNAADVILRVAREMQDWVLAKGEELDAELVGRFRAAGLAVNECDRLAFTIQSLPIYKEFAWSSPAAKAMIKLVFESDLALRAGTSGRPAAKK